MADQKQNAGIAADSSLITSLAGSTAPTTETAKYDAICACRNGYLKSISFGNPVKSQTTQVTRADFPATLVRRNPFIPNELLFAATDNSAGKHVVSPHIFKVDTRSNSKAAVSCSGIKGPSVGFAFGDDNRLFACQADAEGSVYSWSFGAREASNTSAATPQRIFSAGTSVECMEQYRNANDVKFSPFIATGGEENDVAVYDLNRTDGGPIFRAKNIPPNFVQLREPVWVRKLCVMDAECQKILCGTNHHQIRLYDRRVAASVDADAVSAGTDNLCRPVINFNWHDVPVTGLCMSYANENQIFAGNSLGKLEMLDLRMKNVVYAYKGIGGTIKALECHPKQDVLLVGSLDRFVRLYDVKSRRMLKEAYVKSEVNDAVIFKTDEKISWESGAETDSSISVSNNTAEERRGDKRPAATEVNDEDEIDERNGKRSIRERN